MRLNRTLFLGGAAAIAGLLAGAPARSQQPMEPAGLHTLRQPYDIEAFGTFRQLILAGDFSRKIDLAAAMAKRPTIGLGALTDARGEITIHDGKLIVSYGRDGPRARPRRTPPHC
jgi:hypothetical protein